MDLLALAHDCAPNVAPTTILAIVSVESNFNPFAIGIVGGYLQRQPKNAAEAIATAQTLAASDWNYSVGLAQINKTNFERFGITNETAFDACTNIRVGSQILTECFVRHADSVTDPQNALRDAFSCYYSGNYKRGHKVEKSSTSYVQRILRAFVKLSQ